MRSLLTFFILSFSICVLNAQTKEIYTNPNFSKLTAEHKVLACLPWKAIVKLRPKQMQAMTPEQLNKLQSDEGMAAQSAMESYFLKAKENLKIRVSFQPIITTNALLAKNNITEKNIDSFTPQELCALLGVDGILNGLLATEKPMSDGAAVTMYLFVGFAGATNSGKCTINAYDGKTGELLWKYEKTLSRSMGSSTNQVINAMMRKAARKFPYAI